MSGYFALNWPISAGSRYSPGIVEPPTTSWPLSRPWNWSSACRASRERASMRRAYPSMRSPARVVVVPRPSRSSSWTPSSSSRARMCSEIVGWVRKRASAAREKLPSSATFAKISRRRRSIRARRESLGYSVTGATTAAAPAAARHGGRLERAGGLEAEHRQLSHHLLAGAARARDRGRRAGNVLLELLLALLAAVLVDGHSYSPPRCT